MRIRIIFAILILFGARCFAASPVFLGATTDYITNSGGTITFVYSNSTVVVFTRGSGQASFLGGLSTQSRIGSTNDPLVVRGTNGTPLVRVDNTSTIYGEAVQLADPISQGFWDLRATHHVNTGVTNHELALIYNEGSAITNQPAWGENWEPRFVGAFAPNGLLEKNWNFTGINGAVPYRPFLFNINLNTERASWWERGQTWRFSLETNDNPAVLINTDDGGTLSASNLTVGTIGNGTYPLYVRTAPRGGVLAGFQATTTTGGDILLYLNSSTATTGTLYPFYATANATALLTSHFDNSGAGGANVDIQGGSSGDAYVRTLAGQDWAFGADRSDSGKFKITNGDSPGDSGDGARVDVLSIVAVTGYLGIGRSFNTPTNALHVQGHTTLSSNVLVGGTLMFPTNTVTTPPTLALGTFGFWNSNGMALWKVWNTNGATVAQLLP